ncbi:UDP-2,3-diacylglucosamine diphosphatase LpxI [Candidatus Pelagibacter sp.]|nr:UDP-2,3-diacylglucosamine diphosphatase LpxI [Candidatus Pelagibacter sp.]
MIGLIFGDTDFPIKILKTIKKKKIKYLIIDLSKSKKFKKNKNSYSISIGQFGKIIDILKKNNCKKVLFAGKVNKPNFSKLKLDFKGIYYLPRIIKASKIGDAFILKEIIKILTQNKIKTEDSLKFNPELSLKKGNYSKIKPNIQDEIDIKIAIKTLNNLGHYDFSQGVVVRNSKVILVEDKDGTNKMLKKIKSKKFKSHGVLVKFPKKKQDLRIDLPTIGLKTLKQGKLAGLKGLVLKSKQNVFLDKSKCINFANKNKMFIKVT